MKRSFFQATVVSILLYGANETDREKARRQLHKNAASNIEQVLRQQPQKQKLYGYPPPITKTIKV